MAAYPAGRPSRRPAVFFHHREYALSGAVKAHEAGSRTALRELLLDLRTSRVRCQSAWPGNFRRILCGPAGSFSVAGALPRNLSSTKISAPSGSEETETVPTASGTDDEEIFNASEGSEVSAVAGGLAA